MSNTSSVRVAVRIRPLLPLEESQRQGECTRVIPGTMQVQVGCGDDRSFTFDCAFEKDTDQAAIYEECVSPLLEAFFEGFNATILAYGQTGSGKTYTMGSASSARLAEGEQGILPRVINNMYDMLKEGAVRMAETGGTGIGVVSYSVRVQFLEIYGEDINDLLSPVGGQQVSITGGQGGDVVIHGAKEETVHSAEEMLMLLEKGSLCRTTGATLMNAQSSRSHAIFTAILEQRIRTEPNVNGGEEDVEVRRSKFHFVDLAGSERAKRTGAVGDRFREGVEINKGLLTLGNVISALGDEAKRGKVHVPYRDSKLTRMLQDSLGGNSQTLMICCVSPSESNMHETISALRYANRARNIQNKPIVNRDHNSAVISDLKMQIQLLASELLVARGEGGVGQNGVNGAEGSAAEQLISSSKLREMAAITPSKAPQMLQRSNSDGIAQGAGGAELVSLQREVASLRGQVSEAEAEVLRLTEELKQSKINAAWQADRQATVAAERDLLLLSRNGANGDDVMNELISADAQISAGGVLEDTATSEAEAAGGGGAASISNTPRQQAILLLKKLHEHAGGLELKLAESDRQRAQMERQLVANSFMLNNSNGTNGGPRLSLSKKPSFTLSTGTGGTTSVVRRGTPSTNTTENAGRTDDGENVVTRAHEQLKRDRERRQLLLRQLSVEEQAASLAINVTDMGMHIHADDKTPRASADGALVVDSFSDHEDEDEDDVDRFLEGMPMDENEAVRRGASSRRSSTSEPDEEAREAKRREKKIADEIDDLEKGITLKEELLVSLQQNQAKYEVMEQHYERKLGEMDEEVRRMEADHHRLLVELQELEKKSETAKTTEVAALRATLAEKTVALDSMRQKQREIGRLAASKTQDAVRLKGLDEEISRMKRSRVELQRRLDDEKRKQRELLGAKTAEISALRRTAAKSAAEIRRLGAAKTKAEAVGKRHLEELALLRRLQRQKLGVRGKPLTPEERDTKRWLEEKLREVAKREEAAERLSSEYQQKLLLLQHKENLELARDSMTTRKETRGKAQKEKDVLKASVAGVNSSMSNASKDSSDGSSVAGGTSDHPISVEDVEEDETLAEVEDRLYTTTAQLQYKEQKIKALEAENSAASAESAESDEMIQQMCNSANTLPSAHAAMKILFTSLASARRNLRRRDEGTASLEQQLRDANAALEETQEKCQRELRGYDQRIVRVEREHEEKLGGLMQQASMGMSMHTPTDPLSNGSGIDGVSPTSGKSDPIFTLEASMAEISRLNAVLQMSHERNNVLRNNAKSLDIQLAEAEARQRELVEAAKEERRSMAERKQEIDWIKYELKTQRAKHNKLKDEWAEKEAGYKALLDDHHALHAIIAHGTAQQPSHSLPTSPYMKMKALQQKFDRSPEADQSEEFDDCDDFEDDDFNDVQEDIHVIAQGRVPESLEMLVVMSNAGGAGAGTDGIDIDKHQSVFERLAATSTRSHELKLKGAEMSRKRTLPPRGGRRSVPANGERERSDSFDLADDQQTTSARNRQSTEDVSAHTQQQNNSNAGNSTSTNSTGTLRSRGESNSQESINIVNIGSHADVGDRISPTTAFNSGSGTSGSRSIFDRLNDPKNFPQAKNFSQSIQSKKHGRGGKDGKIMLHVDTEVHSEMCRPSSSASTSPLAAWSNNRPSAGGVDATGNDIYSQAAAVAALNANRAKKGTALRDMKDINVFERLQKNVTEAEKRRIEGSIKHPPPPPNIQHSSSGSSVSDLPRHMDQLPPPPPSSQNDNDCIPRLVGVHVGMGGENEEPVALHHAVSMQNMSSAGRVSSG